VHFNLKVLNLLHSLCDHASDTLGTFRAHGYAVEIVEPIIELKGGGTCNPECILASARAQNSWIVESKSGTGSSEDQIRRYEAMQSGDLLAFAAKLWIAKEAFASVDRVYICLPLDAPRQIEQLEILGSSFCVVTYDPQGGRLKLVRGTLTNAALQSALIEGLVVPWPPSPHDYIPFDGNSSDMEIAAAIAPAITAHVLRRRPTFSTYDICRDAIRYWDVLQPTQKTALSTRIERVIENLVIIGFPGQFQVASKGKKRLVVNVTANAARAVQTDYGKAARRLKKMEFEALQALEQKLTAEEKEGEMSLFKDTILPPLARPPRKRRRRQ
jgi:hypothetical protein